MSGAIPLLPYLLPYHAQGLLYLYSVLYDISYMTLVLKSSFSLILELINMWRISDQYYLLCAGPISSTFCVLVRSVAPSVCWFDL
jgi:hypothetical protein